MWVSALTVRLLARWARCSRKEVPVFGACIQPMRACARHSQGLQPIGHMPLPPLPSSLSPPSPLPPRVEQQDGSGLPTSPPWHAMLSFQRGALQK